MSKVTQARKARTRPKSRSGMSGMYYLRRARKFHADIALDDYGDWLRSCKWKIEIAYDDAAGELPLGD